MPQNKDVANRVVTSTALPYRSNISPIESDPCYIPGSSDLLTSINDYAERRPGFSDTVENTASSFVNLQRLFTWDRFDGTFIEMACDLSGSSSIVYKRVIGVDNSFVSIFTDTSANAFDFVVSNNTVYFSNGHVAKKWDPVNGVSNWGIAIGSVNTSIGPNVAGAGTDAGGGNAAWVNPNNVTSSSSYATASMRTPDLSPSNFLKATQFGFSLSSGTTINGIQVNVDILPPSLGGTTTTYSMSLIKNGNVLALIETITVSNDGVARTITFGGSSDLWGTTWTFNDINQTTFGSVLQLSISTGSTQTESVRNVQITIFGSGGPNVTFTGTGLTASVGYQYTYCYGNSNTGHISSPITYSNVVKPTNQGLSIPLVASTDPQVNQIHLYRSTDSVAAGTNAGTFFEIPTSPYPNTTQSVTDTAPDTTLNVNSIAPNPGFNDPPTPGRMPVYFSGRIWLYANNKVYFSDLEESVTGVPEESFVSGTAGNFWTFDQPVQGLAVAGTGLSQTLLIFAGGRIYGITGNTLDTFRRFLISNRRGARNIKSISSMGGIVAWRDTSGQVWITDGNSLQDVSVDIRPDLTPYTPGSDSLSFHVGGRFHWLVVSTGTKLFVYDMDLSQWMPPWSFSCNYLFSGEVSAGEYKLMAATNNIALQMNDSGLVGKFNDNSAFYQPIVKTNLFAMVPDYGKRFSYASLGLYNEPGRTGYLTLVQVTANNNPLNDVLVCTDDDPFNSSTSYVSVADDKVTPQTAYIRNQGKNIIQNIYTSNTKSNGRWVGLQIKAALADDNFRLYEFFLSYKPTGAR